MSGFVPLLVFLCAIGLCAIWWCKSSILRLSGISLFLAGSGALWAPTAAAQDAVYLNDFTVSAPTDAIMVVTDYIELSAPVEKCFRQYVGLAEIVVTGPFWPGQDTENVRGRLTMYVGVENPLRTLKRGDRLEFVSSGVCNGKYVWNAVVIS